MPRASTHLSVLPFGIVVEPSPCYKSLGAWLLINFLGCKDTKFLQYNKISFTILYSYFKVFPALHEVFDTHHCVKGLFSNPNHSSTNKCKTHRFVITVSKHNTLTKRIVWCHNIITTNNSFN